MLKTINRPDDTIKLAGCEIGSSSRVTFDLVGFDFGPFTARLQQSERGEFTVTPDRGETLDAINGTTFTIDYAPVEYGRQCRARLIINTPQRAVSESYYTCQAAVPNPLANGVLYYQLHHLLHSGPITSLACRRDHVARS